MASSRDVDLSSIDWLGPVPDELRELGLRHRLWEDGHVNPLFLGLWEGRRDDMSSLLGCNGHRAEAGFLGVIARDASVPVGLLLLQRADVALPATRWRTKRGGDMVAEAVLPWHVRVRGIVGVYVRPDLRGRGLGVRMLAAVEALRLAEPGPEEWSPDDVPALAGANRAHSLIARAARHHRALHELNDSLRQRRDVDEIVRETEQMRRSGVTRLRPLAPWSGAGALLARTGDAVPAG